MSQVHTDINFIRNFLFNSFRCQRLLTPLKTVRADLVGRPREFHPQPPLEPYVKLSFHTAPRLWQLLLRFLLNHIAPGLWLKVHMMKFPFTVIAFPPFAPSGFHQLSSLLRLLPPQSVTFLLSASWIAYCTFSIFIHRLLRQFRVRSLCQVLVTYTPTVP